MGRDFENLDVWRKACRLAVSVCEAFAKCGNHAVRDQIMRSAISIPSNIAEGAERSSKKEFSRFLDIAKGSAAELRTQLYIASRLKLLNAQDISHMASEAIEISKMLHALISHIDSQAMKSAPKPGADGKRLLPS